MKKLTTCFITYVGVILINNAGLTQTNISGIISSDTNWAVAGSPYIVTGGVLVDSGVTLTIEPGITVKFNAKESLVIDGTFIARGTETDKITFTTNSVGDNWGQLFFRDSSTDATYDVNGDYISGSILEYCIVEYTGGISETSNGVIRMVNAYPFINYCTIQNNTSNGIFALNNAGTIKIMNNIIRNNNTGGTGGTPSAGGGILIVGGSTIISNNNINNNTASNGGGIYINSGTLITISDNIISNNTALEGGGGIANDNGTITISNNIIINNTASDGGGGIRVGSENVNISNNIISNNSVSNGNGGGIAASFFWVEITISNNAIINNRAINMPGVSYDARYDRDVKYNTITGNQATGSSPTYTVYVKQHPLFNYNNIFNNTATYELWNDNSNLIADVDATNNWWGTISDSIIQSKIYDWFDNASLGIVNYNPFLSVPHTAAPISPPMNVVKANENGDVQLMWRANSEMDVAGYKIYYGSPTGYSFENVIDVGNVINYTVSGVSIFDTIAVTAYDIIADGVNDQLEGHESWFTIATTPYGDVSLNGEVTPYDASLILEYLVDYIDLNSSQLQTANVSLDTTVSAFDASLILQHFAGLIDTLPYATGDLLLASGDMKMDDDKIQAGQPVEVLLYLSNGDNIFSFEGLITFNPEYLTFDTLTWSELANDFSIETNAEAGEIKFAGAGSVPDGESDVFASLQFEVNENLTEDKTVIALSKLRWNENEVMENVASATLTNMLSVDDKLNGVPLEFGLSQNYPNPLNPVTTISYQLPKSEFVNLSIYNAAGQLVETLVNEHKNANYYSVVWNANGISSGVYFYKIVAAEYVAIRKCLILK